MSDFKRSPSKIWWASESVEWREISGSPGSQDSGFSDTETPPLLQKNSEPEKPQNLAINLQDKSNLYKKYSPKINRNLFNTKNKSYQYAKVVRVGNSLVVERKKERFNFDDLNKTAPAVLEEVREDDESFHNSLSSDCESELECLFNGGLESPKHTSTPKNVINKMRSLRRSLHQNLLAKDDRIISKLPDSVKKWMEEIKSHYEQECMTTLQSKSISAELNQKVTTMATYTTTALRNIISHSDCLQQEYKKLNSEQKYIAPLAQSLAGNIIDFIKSYSVLTPKITKQYDLIRKSTPEELLKLIPNFVTLWEGIYHEVLEKETKKLTDKLENPASELDLRASVTGVTYLCLRNENLIEIFVKNEIVPILLILCEKCQGSSLRSLLLRALSTLCSTNFAVRQFEKYSGIQIIAEILDDSGRPEPEKSEAVALLAQITAPWIEDNHSIKNLQNYSKKLVKSLTRLVSTTKCCQNLLLCTAALANLTSMDSKCIKYLLHLNTMEILLSSVKKRGPFASIYLYEQVATLVANMTSLEVARRYLTQLQTIPALLCFLKMGNVDRDVEKRLQQKAIIALSRLCGQKEAAEQVVENGGVEKLVKMCREKNERFSNDAVLVATLATLRKIADACGKEVISVEDVQELVEPKLLDSFLAYSTQNESYV